MIKISIIITIFNSESTIKKCVESLMNQTLRDIEFIFIDDKSTDNSIKILETIIEKSNIKYLIIKNEVNIGQSLSRKKGVNFASGEYITFVDSDDWLEKNMYEIMYKVSENGIADIVTCDYFRDNKKYSVIKKNKCDDLISGILTNNTAGSLWNKIFRRELFDQDLIWPVKNMGEDAAICIQLVLNAKIIIHTDIPLYHYCIYSNSTLNSQDREKYLDRFYGLKESSEIIFTKLNNLNISKKYSSAIKSRKVFNKLIIAPIINEKAIYKHLNRIYPEVTFNSVLRYDIPLSIKIQYFLLITKLYPIILKLKKTLSYKK